MLKEDSLKNKVAVITGGGTGLGQAMAVRFAALGAKVFILSRSDEHLKATAALIQDKKGVCAYATCDIRKEDDVKKTVADIVQKWGRIDILVNNAAGNFICPSKDLSLNGWNAVVGIVLTGTFLMSREVGKIMLAQSGGAILNIIATYAWTGSPGVVHSASAKAGVVAMTRTLASEWAPHGIRVNCLAPGPIETEGASEKLWPTEEKKKQLLSRIPAGRFGKPEEVAELAAFLVSDSASYMTGDVAVLDGGQWFGANALFRES